MKPPPPRVRRRKPGNELTLLFTNSWHQNPVSFFLRGGLDVLSAIRVLKRRYPKLRVVLRTALPGLREPYQRILGMEGVEIIDRFLSKSEWDSLLRDADVYLLPAARIHVVSALQAMAHGLCVIASDGWGFDEYITHGHDGLLVRGRYGKTSWIERETGVLREDYSLMYEPNKDTTQQIVDYVTRLVEDRAYREMLQHNARVTVQEKFNLHQWNEGLRQLFDRALA
jgi:glycosyltransferase involved in cell wall biosynthesis